MKRLPCHPCFAQLLLPTLGMLLLAGCSTAKGRLGGTLTSDDAVNTHSFVVRPQGSPQRRQADNASSSFRGPEAGVGYSLTAADRPSYGSSTVLLARQCDEHISYAFSLAERGAAYSAREEFIEALQLVSGALDADNGTQTHSRSLKAGLRALQEADDFAPRQLRHETELDFTYLTATHQTPVLKGVDKTRLKPIDALQSYYSFATQQLARAGGDEPAASLALYGLGRVEAASSARPSVKIAMGGPKAIALHQAALMVNPQNHMAANELGVLLARYGQMKDAKDVLLHSLSASPQPETWHNLAIVHQNLGELEQARQARMNCESLTAVNRTRRDRAGTSTPNGVRPAMRWVAPEAFVQSGGPGRIDGLTMNSRQPASPQPQTQAKSVKTEQKELLARLVSWLKPTSPQQADSVIRSARQNHPVP